MKPTKSFVRSLVRSFVHSFVCSFVRSFIHSFIHSFTIRLPQRSFSSQSLGTVRNVIHNKIPYVYLKPSTAATQWKTSTDLRRLWSIQLEALDRLGTEAFLEPLSSSVSVIEAHHDRPVSRSPRTLQSVYNQPMQWTCLVGLHKTFSHAH